MELTSIRASLNGHSLSELCLPLGLSDNELQQLGTVVMGHSLLQPGEHVYHAGQTGESIYAVRSGSVKSYIPAGGSDEQVIGFHLPRELLGFEAFNGAPYSSSAVALETSDICEIPFQRLEELCARIPNLQHQINRLIGREVKNDHSLLLLLGKKSSDVRLANLLLSISQRMRERGYSATDINLTMSRRDMANYLGLAEETVSRLFTQFQSLDLLVVERKHVKLLDIAGLERLAESA